MPQKKQPVPLLAMASDEEIVFEAKYLELNIWRQQQRLNALAAELSRRHPPAQEPPREEPQGKPAKPGRRENKCTA